jgi:pimeloyl-ACP methyl ester carboxylesterase
VTAPECPLVLLPGLHGSVRLFDPLVRELRRRFPQAAFVPLPLPGEGPQDYPTLLDHFLGRLEKQGPLLLLAESFSVPLALLLAASPRLRVERLILAAGFAGPPRTIGLSLLPLRSLLGFRPPKPAIRKLLAGDRVPESLVTAIHTELQAARGQLLAARIRAALAVGEHDLPCPDMPTLLLQARHDAIIPWEAQSQLERHLPHAVTTWLPGPHLLLQASPHDAAEAISSFLAD